MNKYSKAAQKAIGAKMHKMKDEDDKSHAQKIAIAIAEAKKRGFKVP